jgi:hypothetical protein
MFLGRACEREIQDRQVAASLGSREGRPIPVAPGEVLVGIPHGETIPALLDREMQADQRECSPDRGGSLARVLGRVDVDEELVPATELDDVLVLEPGDLAVQRMARLGGERARIPGLG